MRSQSDQLERAVTAFEEGRPVLVHDSADREGETDILYPAAAVTAADVARMRNDGGGLLFVAVPHRIAEAFGLPFLEEAIDHPAAENPQLAYDDRSSFSLTVNHRETFTGVTDRDRALTITELAAAADAADVGHDATPEAFAERFRTPGHVHVLRGAEGGLASRTGHTELALALAEAAGCAPAVAGCEMLDGESGGATSAEAARAYAQRHGLVYVEGATLIDALGE